MSKPFLPRLIDRHASVLGATALALALGSPGAFAFDSGSTGTDGELAPTVNTEIQLPDG